MARQGAVYDDEKTGEELDELENKFAAKSAGDDDLPEGHPSRKDSLKKREEEDSESGDTKAEGGERSFYKADDESESDSDSSGKKSWRARILNRKTATRGGIVGLLVGGGLGIAIITSGPMQIITFAKLLGQFHFANSENFQDSRTGRLIRYARTVNNPNRRNLGFIGNQFADHYQRKLKRLGFDLDFTTPNGNQGRFLRSISIDPDTPNGKHVLGEMLVNGADVPAVKEVNGVRRVTIDIGSSDAEFARKSLRSMTGTMELNKVSSFVSKRLLIRRARVNFHPLTKLRRATTDTRLSFIQIVKDKFTSTRRNGVTIDTPTLRADGSTNPDGTVTDPTPDGVTAAAEGTDAVRASQTGEPRASRISGVKAKLAAGAGVVGIFCAVKQVGDSSETLKYTNIILPLIRTGIDIVAIGSQAMTGQDTTLDELGAINSTLYDPETRTSWASARSIQAELGQELTGPDIPPTASPGRVGEKPAIFRWVDSIFSGSFGLASVACSKIGQFVLGAITPIQTIAQEAIFALSRATTGTDPVLMLTGWIVDVLAGEEVNTEAAGADLGNMANYGVRLAANDASIAIGGTELSNTEVALLDKESSELQKQEFSQKSFATRVLDPYETRSLFSKAIVQNQNFASVTSMSDSLVRIPGSIFSQFGSTLGKLFPSARALDIDGGGYSYEFPEYGFSQADMDDPRVADPYENADIMEAGSKLAELNTRYGDCFSTTIDPNGVLVTGDAKRYDEIGDECRDGSEDLLRYRFYLADVTTAKSLACYEGMDEAACKELGFDTVVSVGVPPASTTGTPIAPGLNGYTIPCTGQPRTVVRRAEGTNGPSADWTGIPDSGTIGTTVQGKPIKVYVRDVCDKTSANIKTIVIVSSIHGSENGGQYVSHELLFNAQLPANVRIIAIPELNGDAIPIRDRQNANGVDLNRNNDYLWSSLNLSTETTPGAFNYKGSAPGSEPETAAANSFLTAVGKASLSLHYHDSLDYVAPVGSTPVRIAQTYASAAAMQLGNDTGQIVVSQRGSLDAWYNSKIGTPALLIELGANQSQAVINRNVDAIKALITSNVI